MTKSPSNNRIALLVTTAAIACAATAARAYTVMILQPPTLSLPGSEGEGISGGQVPVNAPTSDEFALFYTHAFLWTPSSNSLVDLQPPGFQYSKVKASNGLTQVGSASAYPYGPSYAIRWSGSASSAVDINPTGSVFSIADGISPDGRQIVGEATFDVFSHATLWNDGDVVDLNPTSGYYHNTYAAATNGVRQVGAGQAPGMDTFQALAWSGSADSVVNLQPAGYTASAALNLWGYQAVGYAAVSIKPQVSHAAVWDLSNGTFADLNGALLQSGILATNGSTQVGSGNVSADGTIHAALWHGTADSYVDLNALLPGNYNYSRATGIDADGNISGVAHNADTGYYEAVVWLVPEPTGLLPLAAAAIALTPRRRRRPFQ